MPTFRSTFVSDAGLAQLVALKELSTLIIIAPQVTDTGLIALEELPNLTSLDLISTRVTPEGIERLRQAGIEARQRL
jgi:hypothetical protein